MTTRLDELQAALAAATAGPWQSTRTDPAEGYDCCWLTASPNGRNNESEIGSISLPANAAAIVLLRNNASDLLAVARAAQRYLNGHNGADGVALHDALAKLTG